MKTESTFPPKGVFMKNARTIARVLGSKKVSPKGIGSGSSAPSASSNRKRDAQRN